MGPPNWTAFASVSLVVLVALIALARASQTMFDGEGGDADEERRAGVNPVNDTGTATNERVRNGGTEHIGPVRDGAPPAPETAAIDSDGDRRKPSDERAHPNAEATAPSVAPSVEPAARERKLTPGALLVNVALSQGLFGAILVAVAVLSAIPPDALGVGRVTVAQFGVGVLLGVALYAANELGQRLADALEIEYEDGLREMLTPDALGGWFVLLVLVLPIIAGFEELLFRSSLVGVFAAGFGISPWLLVVASSVAFAAGHGAQGPAGMLVTGTLGAVLASAFVLTGSLLVVVVAHYIVNALEFVVHADGKTTET